MLHNVPWQHAVYTRRNQRDTYYTFSHARTASVSKAFPPSLKPQSLAQPTPLANLQAMRDAPVLILVTGRWATVVSVEAYTKHKGCLEKLPLVMYDHLADLPERGEPAECSEIGKDYRLLRYHSTLATYDQGERHDWALTSVVPMLSDLVILPTHIHERRLKPIMASFCRVTRKCLADSLILAGDGGKCREVAIKQ
jgi:hypothetical protein